MTDNELRGWFIALLFVLTMTLLVAVVGGLIAFYDALELARKAVRLW